MKIARNRLQGIRFERSAHTGGPIEPKFVVMHYTAGGSIDSSLRAINNRGLSAHLFVDREGGIVQTVDFTTRAHHAGPSSWRGFTGLNGHSIGIEICNIGWLDQKSATGWTRSDVSRTYPEHEVIVARHKNGGRTKAWELYPEPQLRALNEIVAALFDKYPSLQEVVGHDDISPTRKQDPGPAFPMGRFQHIANSNRGSASLARDDLGRFEVAVRTTLNMRGGPGTNFDVVKSLKAGAVVRGLDEVNDWIAIDLKDDGVKDGFVHSAFLRRIGD